MVKKILDIKAPSLHLPSKRIEKIDKKVLSLIEDMEDTLAFQKDPEGVGLAAPQIGKNVQMFLVKFEGTDKVIINPEIVSISKKKSDGKSREGKLLEGCLSLPHYYGPIKRAESLVLKYMDPTGKTVTEEFGGFMAHIVQHEVDHLNGVLFVDHILKQKAPLYLFDGDDWEEVELVLDK